MLKASQTSQDSSKENKPFEEPAFGPCSTQKSLSDFIKEGCSKIKNISIDQKFKQDTGRNTCINQLSDLSFGENTMNTIATQKTDTGAGGFVSKNGILDINFKNKNCF